MTWQKRTILNLLPFLSISFFAFSGCGKRTLNLALRCTSNCNDNNAIVVRIYQLKNDENFRLATRETLLRDARQSLGDDFISKKEITLAPNDVIAFDKKDTITKFVKETKFIGVVGDFFKPDREYWRQVHNLQDGKKFEIVVKENRIEINKR